MKKAAFGKFAISSLVALYSLPGIGQSFQKLYGSPEHDIVFKVIPEGSGYYVLGASAKPGQTEYNATVTRLTASGTVAWSRIVDTPSIWNDAIVIAGGDLMAVGRIAQSGGPSPGIIGLIDPSGNFKWLKAYSDDYFYSVVQNQSPQNASFPFYVLGSKSINGLPAPTLKVIDAQGNPGWEKYYTYSAYQEYYDNLEAAPNGDLLISGYTIPSSQNVLKHYGVIFRADKTGNIFNSAGPESESHITDLAVSASGEIYAAGLHYPAGSYFIQKYSTDLLPVWERKLSSPYVYNIWLHGNSIFLTTGFSNGKSQHGLAKLSDNGSSVSLDWSRYLDPGSGQVQIKAYSAYLNPGKIIYADTRIASNATNLREMFVSVSGDSLKSCLSQQVSESLLPGTNTFYSPALPVAQNMSITQGTNIAYSNHQLAETDLCPDACNCTFSNLQINGPGSQVQTLTCGGAPVTLGCQPGAGYTVTGTWGPCPSVKSILVDACATEAANEFLLIYSGGKGFNVNDLSIDFDAAVNIPGNENNDINTGISPCGFQQGNTAMITGCQNVIAAGPGTFIPPGSYLIVQTSASAAGGLYNFSAFCNTLQPVYVVRSSCARSAEAFPNLGPGTVSTSVSFAGSCSSSVVYSRSLLSGSNGDHFIAPSTYLNNGCVAPPPALVSSVPAVQFNWTLSGPGAAQNGTYNGSGPLFSLSLPPTYFTQQGLYTLTLEGICGDKLCPCTVQFNVNCPDPCPCSQADIDAFEANVDKGFATSFSNNNCEVCFSPLALNGCHTVEWQLSPFTGPPIGTSTGNQTFCHTFPWSGFYNVKMIVTQKKSDGTICEIFSKTQTVDVICTAMLPPADPLFKNSGFSQSPVAGGLNSGGSATGWTGSAGNPVLVSGAEGSQDGWSMFICGNASSADVLSSIETVCIPAAENGMLSLRLRVPTDPIPGADVKVGKRPPPPVKKLSIQFSSGSGSGCPAGNCHTVAVLEELFVSNDWYEVRIPYNLSSWTTAASCGKGSGNIPVRIHISVSNQFTDDQGDGYNRDYILIDHISLNNLSTSVELPAVQPEAMRLYPNPASGVFTLELAQAPEKGAIIRIIKPSGQIVQEKKAQAGECIHNFDTGSMPAGTYFVQIFTDGYLKGVEKLIVL